MSDTPVYSVEVIEMHGGSDWAEKKVEYTVRGPNLDQYGRAQVSSQLDAEKISWMCARAFEAGRRYQASIIREALNPK
jgi:hypothetical protein